jgi:hypothetical protein
MRRRWAARVVRSSISPRSQGEVFTWLSSRDKEIALRLRGGVEGIVSALLAHLGRAGLRLLVPVWSTLDPAALVLAIGAFLALFRWKIGMLETLATSAAAGLVWWRGGIFSLRQKPSRLR